MIAAWPIARSAVSINELTLDRKGPKGERESAANLSGDDLHHQMRWRCGENFGESCGSVNLQKGGENRKQRAMRLTTRGCIWREEKVGTGVV